MSTMVLLGALAVGLSLPLLLWSISTGGGARQAVADNLARGLVLGGDLRAIALTQPAANRALRPVLRRLAALTRHLTPEGWLASLERRVWYAGQPAAWPLERVLAAKAALGAAGVVLGVLRVLGTPRPSALAFAVVAAGAGFFLPDLLLWRRASQRQEEIRRKLPDTLDQMTICVQAGLGFEGALARAARSGTGALAEEFRRTLQEMHIGATRSQALRSLQERSDVPELRRLVLALTQADAYGLPIADVLRVQAGELRERRRQRAEERAMKLPVKIVFPLVLCILPCLMIVVLAPAGIRIMRFFAGG